MKRKFLENNGKQISYLEKDGNGKNPTLVFIHGFAGDAEDWLDIINRLNDYHCIAIDLIGHGNSFKSENENDYTTSSFSLQLDYVLSHLRTKSIVLIGYSMGGRIALNYYLSFQNKTISALILESSSPGIFDKEEKEKRLIEDKKRSEVILNGSLKDFFLNWYKSPIFASLNKNPQLLQNLINKRSENSKQSLAYTIKKFSPSLMPSMWDKLHEIKIPFLVIYGEEDTKYSKISTKIARINNSIIIKGIPEAGHNTHLEKPDEFYDIIFCFLNKFQRNI